MGSTGAQKAGGKGRAAFFQRARFLLTILSFVSAPAGVGLALRLFGHLTLRSSLIWATLSYPLILAVGAVIGVSMLFRGPVGEIAPERAQPTAMETEPERQQDPLIG
ncbi:hypothetical protein [Roseixanthobacter liquoris]|uniref:hypothetical protein n=1 Tax=Roseixanthobacter liquoris TaxID=3119921 RepID=UPI00372A255F